MFSLIAKKVHCKKGSSLSKVAVARVSHFTVAFLIIEIHKILKDEVNLSATVLLLSGLIANAHVSMDVLSLQ